MLLTWFYLFLRLSLSLLSFSLSLYIFVLSLSLSYLTLIHIGGSFGFLWQWISDNGFWCQVSLFEEFLLGLELVGCSWFLQNPFFYYLIFSWFCMFFCFVLGGERHKRGGKIYIFIHIFNRGGLRKINGANLSR